MLLLRKAARELQGRTVVAGMPISIENRRGSIRQWYDPNSGTQGMTRMRNPYGYFKGTVGEDGDAVDVYVGPHHQEASMVYIINQMKAPEFTEHDEQKIMVGYLSQAEAVTDYLMHYDDQRFLGSVQAMPVDEFREKAYATMDGGSKMIKSGEAYCKKIGDELGVDWGEVDLDEFCDGMFDEEEHQDVTGGDPKKTAKIVLAHLKEHKHYYSKLKAAGLEKSHVQTHTRRTKSGRVVLIGAYDDKRTNAGRGRLTKEAGLCAKAQEVKPAATGIVGKSEAELRQIASDRGLRVPPVWTDLWVNEDASAGLQVKGRDTKGVLQRIYSAKHAGAAAESKFERVKAFAKVYRKLMAKIEEDIPKVEEARVLYLIAKTGFRLGSEKERGEVKAYGASNMRTEHATVNGDTVTFDFTGKKGVGIVHTVKDAKIAAMVQNRKKGQLFNTDEHEIRKYMAQIGYGDFLIKDFRTFVANDVALKTIAKLPAPKDQKEFKQAVKTVCEAVADKLGNTWSVAREAYISPEVFSKWTV